MKKIRRILTSGSALILLGALAACSQSSAGEFQSRTLTYSSAFAPGGLNAGMEYWVPIVEDRIGGDLSIDFHYSESLVSGFDTLSAIGSGTVDFGTIPPSYNPAELPLANVLSIPFQTSDPIAQMHAFYEMTQENDALREEYERANVHVLMLQPAADGAVGLKDPIDDVEDLDGQRLRAIGFIVPGLQELGIEPVAVNPGEIYESIQRGVISGYAGYVFDNLHTLGVHEVAPNTYDIGLGQYSVQVIGVNLDLWESLDPEVRDTMTQAAEEFMSQHAADLLTQFETEACDAILAEGGSVSVFTDEQAQEVNEIVGDLPAEEWIKAVADAGVSEDDAREFRDDFLSRLEYHEAQDYGYVSGMRSCAER